MPRALLHGVDAACDAFAAGGVPALREALQRLLARLPAEAWQPVAALCGHAHLDLVWLWPEMATERKAVHTFATQLRLLARDPDAVFVQSQPALYRAVDLVDFAARHIGHVARVDRHTVELEYRPYQIVSLRVRRRCPSTGTDAASPTHRIRRSRPPCRLDSQSGRRCNTLQPARRPAPTGLLAKLGAARANAPQETDTMPRLIAAPTRIQAAGNKPKLIDEYVGRVNTQTAGVSIARMRSPGGWSEPRQRPEFTEYTIVLAGMVRVEYDGGTLDVPAGQAVIAEPGEAVRYSTPLADGADYLAVCIPAFSPQSVHRDE